MLGITIDHYKITAKLGQGGMGEVYRATDTKLDREVAIKVLPQSVAQDKERLARFGREAKVLAQLNHPNIAGVYGLEQSGDIQALILELVEGDDLSLRLKRGPLPVDESLEVCKQIAEALEAAHEKGIIHRDLKPGNIKMTEEGKVKVLDFGLAKALSDESDTLSESSAEDSPTITDAFTKPGTILGTAAYMSPEQARGKHVDKRSDIWAFGCVLFECLTGRKAFGGSDVTETLAGIIKGEPEWSALPADTPATVQLLLRKCLAKDRRKRVHHVADVRVDLEQAISDPSTSVIQFSGQALTEPSRKMGLSHVLLSGIALLGIVLVVAVTWLVKNQPAPEVRQIAMDLGMDAELELTFGTAVRISPDESRIAYMTKSDTGIQSLMIRRIDQLNATSLPGTEGVTSFCFSPDSQWICFGLRYADEGSIKKISIEGEVTTRLCSASQPRGVSWSKDGWIYFTPNWSGGVFRVQDSGGDPVPITQLKEEERTHKWPEVLPDGESVLFTSSSNSQNFEDARIMIQPLAGGDPKELVKGYHGRYLASGHLAYIYQDSLYVERFDPQTYSIPDPKRVPIISGVSSNRKGGSHFDISPKGTMVYMNGKIPDSLYQFQWVDRNGEQETLPLPPSNYGSFKLSPDGKKLAFSMDSGSESGRDIWIYDLERRTQDRLTFGTNGSNNKHPVWSPDGKWIAFKSDMDGGGKIHLKSTKYNEPAVKITENDSRPFAWNPDGEHIVFGQVRLDSGVDLRILKLNGANNTAWSQAEVTDFVATEFSEWTAAFSPDGNWIAYASNESLKWKIYIRDFPVGSSRIQVSNEGKTSGWPVWSQGTSEIFFESSLEENTAYHQIFVSKYQVHGKQFLPEAPVLWPGSTHQHQNHTSGFDYDSDNDRLLVRQLYVNEDVEKSEVPRAVLFEGFFEFLKIKLPQ
jgi:serine/threonine-protein kinase